MLERMRSSKAYLESLKVDILKLMNAKSDQEEINELLVKSFTDPSKNNGKNSSITIKKRNGEIQSGGSEETTDNILALTPGLQKYNDLKFEKKKSKTCGVAGRI